MICPHCSTSVKFQWMHQGPINIFEDGVGSYIFYDSCPNCNEVVIGLAVCNYYSSTNNIKTKENGDYDMISDKIVYPSHSRFGFPEFIPEKYYKDYEESLKVLVASPKASAALSRRLLQIILREKYNITKKNLSLEIDAFIALPGVPSHIIDAVDAIRHVGNFAAHPMKNTNTGEIVDVEPGEAEWLIEVIEALFDFCFVQPEKIEQRRAKLNAKLEELGKSPLK